VCDRAVIDTIGLGIYWRQRLRREHRYSTQQSGPPPQTPHHPSPAECVNSLTGGPRSQPRFRPNRQDQRPTDTPLTHRGFPTAVSSPLHAPVQIHTPCGR
jgi:hypothetical protein